MKSSYKLEHKIKIAREYESQGKHLHALQIYNSLLSEHPNDLELNFNIAEIFEHLGNIQSAIDLLKNLLQNDQENKEVRLYYGQYLLRHERWDAAVDVLSYLVPEEEPVVSFFLGYSNFMLKDYELAKLNFQNFIRLDKKSELIHEANVYLSKIEIELHNFESALTFAKKAGAMYENFWELNLIYAVIYFNLGMYAHAVNPIEKTIKLNPNEVSAYEWAGKIYLKLGDYLKAEKKFLKYIESIEDASSDIYIKLAEACLKGKKAKDALAYYDIALKLDPENASAKEGRIHAASLLKKNMVSDG